MYDAEHPSSALKALIAEHIDFRTWSDSGGLLHTMEWKSSQEASS